MDNKLICIATLIVALGCKAEEDKSSKATTASSEPAPSASAPVLDTKIASAVASAAGASDKAQAAAEGPPENGILGLERANEELAKGAPATVKLGSAGSEPRIRLGANDWGDKRTGQLELSVRTGAGIIPTTAFKFDIRKAPANGAEPSSAPAYTLDIVSSELAATQPAEIPPALAAEIRKLKGGHFTALTGATGLLGSPAPKLASGANQQLDSLMQAGSATLNDAIPAFPSEAVGVGAFWLVKSREELFGADVVAYRMIKVVEIDKEQVVLDVNTKRYLADTTLGLPGLEQAEVHQFQSEGSTQMTLTTGTALPLDGRSQTSLRAFVEMEGQPRPVQVEMRGLFTFSPQPAAPKQ
jgi:hypothetical protein